MVWTVNGRAMDRVVIKDGIDKDMYHFKEAGLEELQRIARLHTVFLRLMT